MACVKHVKKRKLNLMKVGVPKEIKTLEYRVGLSPSSVLELVKRGHEVIVQKGAGEGAGFMDAHYVGVGARMVDTIEKVYQEGELIVKIKEPQKEEYGLLKPHHTLFTYLHLAASEELTKALIQSGATCIAYETVQKKDGLLPLLQPMSEIAGRLAVIEGAKYLQKAFGGKGKLISGAPGVASAQVVVLGGGSVGTQAAKMAAGLQAQVILFDKNLQRLRYLEEVMPANVRCLFSNEMAVAAALTTADIVVGAVLVPGLHAPKLVRKEHLSLMELGTVLVDVAIDQGGCFETSHPTTHKDPTYLVEGIVHYAVANMPGSVPRTATEALNNATLPYVVQLADKGFVKALNEDPELAKGLNIKGGELLLTL